MKLFNLKGAEYTSNDNSQYISNDNPCAQHSRKITVIVGKCNIEVVVRVMKAFSSGHKALPVYVLRL